LQSFLVCYFNGEDLKIRIILSPSLSILVFLLDTDLRCYLAREWYLVGTDGANAKTKSKNREMER